jgi:ribosomal protein S12 methylthiotransferase accessory factor
MNPLTLLPGKDAPVEETIDMANSLLDRAGFSAEPVTWLNPAPGCWSVHIRSKECEHIYTNGKGTSQQASLASGLGEYLERLSTNFFFSDFFLEKDSVIESPFLYYPDEKWFPVENEDNIPHNAVDGKELLNSRLRKFYDSSQELQFDHLRDNNSEDMGRGICCLPFSDSHSNSPVYFPVSILNNLYVSNGMAAGNSKTECYSQALSEIIERYVKNHVISNGVALPDVPASILKKFHGISAILSQFKKHDIGVQIKDCSLGGKFPVICVLLSHRPTGGAYAAFGASFRFETAIERTLTELLQGRQFEQLDSFHSPVHDLSLAADSFNLESHFIDSDGLLAWNMFRAKPDHPFTPWNFSGTTEKEYLLLRDLVMHCGYRIYAADYIHCGMPTCRIIVPGMSEIYPVDDLIWNNKNSGTTIRKHLLRLPHMNSVELQNFLETLEEMNIGDQYLISDIIGVIFGSDSEWHHLSVGELKALLFLALQQHENAREWCNWCHKHGNLPQHRQKFFRLLDTLLNFKLSREKNSSYRKGLHLYFEEEKICEAESVIAGKITFPGLTFASSWRALSPEHDNLLKLYGRLDEVKKKPITL